MLSFSDVRPLAIPNPSRTPTVAPARPAPAAKTQVKPVGAADLEGACNLFHLVSLDHVALANIAEGIDTDAAFEPFADLLGIILEALQGTERAIVDDHIVTQQANPRTRGE